MRASAILTKGDIEKAIIEYTQRINKGMVNVKAFEIVFDIEAPCNSGDQRENTMGGLRGATISEKPQDINR